MDSPFQIPGLFRSMQNTNKPIAPSWFNSVSSSSLGSKRPQDEDETTNQPMKRAKTGNNDVISTKKRIREDHETTDDKHPGKRVNLGNLEIIGFTKENHTSSSAESSKETTTSFSSRSKYFTTEEQRVKNRPKKDKPKKKNTASNQALAKSEQKYSSLVIFLISNSVAGKYPYANLPTELHEMIFQHLHPITSACLGVTCRFLYRMHRKFHPEKIHLLMRPQNGDYKTGHLSFLLRKWMAPKYTFREGKFYSDEGFRRHMADRDAKLLEKLRVAKVKREAREQRRLEKQACRLEALREMMRLRTVYRITRP